MTRVLVLFALIATSFIAQRAAAQGITIPGTRARIVLPEGCAAGGPGRVVCGPEAFDVGGSALAYDEIAAIYRTRSLMFRELSGQPRAFFATLDRSRAVFVVDGRDERLFVLASSERMRPEVSGLYARVLAAFEPPARGAVVTGFEQLPREELPHATVYWSNGVLMFNSSVVGVSDRRGTAGFIQRVENATMTTLCDNSTVMARLSSTLFLRHQRVVNDQVSLCEEAFVSQTTDGRTLTAQFGYVLRGGPSYAIVMNYGLEPTEDPSSCIQGFENFALRALPRIVGLQEPSARRR